GVGGKAWGGGGLPLALAPGARKTRRCGQLGIQSWSFKSALMRARIAASTMRMSRGIFVIGAGSSLQTIVNVFTYVSWTCAYGVSCWHTNQGGQYKAAE